MLVLPEGHSWFIFDGACLGEAIAKTGLSGKDKMILLCDLCGEIFFRNIILHELFNSIQEPTQTSLR